MTRFSKYKHAIIIIIIIIIIITCAYRFLFVCSDTYIYGGTYGKWLDVSVCRGTFGLILFQGFRKKNVLNPWTNRDVTVSKIKSLKNIPDKRSDYVVCLEDKINTHFCGNRVRLSIFYVDSRPNHGSGLFKIRHCRFSPNVVRHLQVSAVLINTIA